MLETPQGGCNQRCASLLQGHYLNLFLGTVREVLERAGAPSPDECLRGLEEALYKSTHLARARSVAYLVGFCRYFGRLVESYGVMPYYTSVTPGKGTLVHKILAVAAAELLERVDPLSYNYRDVEQAVNYAIEEIASKEMYQWIYMLKHYKDMKEKGAYTEAQTAELDERVKGWEKRLEAAKKDAVDMLDNLLKLIGRLVRIDYLSRPSDLYVLPEHQMADYDLKVIGTPDLILESGDGKAVVVEWKTMANPERSGMDYVSHAQSWLYSLMEARRLGYGSGDSSDPLGELREALNPHDPAVLPAVITPKRFYVRHPLGARLGQQLRKYADPCCTTLLLIIASYHLAALHLMGSFNDKPCKVDGSKLGVPSENKVRVYSYTPPILRDGDLRLAAGFTRKYSGNPDKIDEIDYPCGRCKVISNGLVPLACKLNFAGGRETGRIDSVYYITRNIVLARHLKDLEPLKAAYYVNPEDLLECRGSFKIERSGSARQLWGSAKCEIMLEGGSTYRYLSPWEARFSSDFSDGDLVELVAPVTPGVTKLLEEVRDEFVGGLRGFMRPVTLRAGKPVAVYLYNNVSRTGKPTRLTHSPAAWLRVNDIEVNGDKVVITLGLPSTSLKLNYLLFLRHLERAGCRNESKEVVCSRSELKAKGYGIVAVESQVDLTQYDLRIVNQLRLLLALVRDKHELMEALKEAAVEDEEGEIKESLRRLDEAEDKHQLLTAIIASLLSEHLKEPEAERG